MKLGFMLEIQNPARGSMSHLLFSWFPASAAMEVREEINFQKLDDVRLVNDSLYAEILDIAHGGDDAK